MAGAERVSDHDVRGLTPRPHSHRAFYDMRLSTTDGWPGYSRAMDDEPGVRGAGV